MRRFIVLVTLLVGCSGPADSPKTGSDPDSNNANNADETNNSNATNSLNNTTSPPDNNTSNNCVGEPDVCSDGDACTRDAAQYDAATCQTLCSFAPIDACASGDGCCPEGCTTAEDDDCVCTPSTCEDLGRTCGTANDGCGNDIECGECGFDEACSGAGVCEQAEAPTCNGIGDCPVGYNHCSMGECLECLTPPDCAEDEVCVDARCEPSPDCTADPAVCPMGYTCTDGTCVGDQPQTCDPMDPMSCPNGSFCDPATATCSGAGGPGCGLCNPDCTCPDAAFMCNGLYCASSDPTACLQCSGDQALCMTSALQGEYLCLPN